jgi:restriction system protein
MSDSASDKKPVPDYQTIMLPLLKVAGDDREHAIRDTIEQLAEEFCLTPEQRREMLPKGSMTKWVNRIYWASTYLRKAGLLESVGRGVFQISDKGRAVLQDPPDRITIAFLSQFDSFNEFRKPSESATEKHDVSEVETETPEEILESAYQRLREEVAEDILERIKAGPPVFFEKLVVELLVKMGYGGTVEDAGHALGASGDGGVDGLIKQDRLGLDTLYIQAKRWQQNVGEPEIRDFVGALVGKAANKGVFLTTSDFTDSAKAYAVRIPQNLVLLDGKKIADYMIDFNLGVTSITTYELKRVDTDYFEEA